MIELIGVRVDVELDVGVGVIGVEVEGSLVGPGIRILPTPPPLPDPSCKPSS